jgi:DNA-binding winged helix-turn-helix (wHTH) protein
MQQGATTGHETHIARAAPVGQAVVVGTAAPHEPGEQSGLESSQMDGQHLRYSGEVAGFTLGSWVVQPRLNRLAQGEVVVQLEPKLMDVLAFLAGRPGQVVSKDELIEGVWKLEFISEWVITRAVAKLRRALGDDAQHPRYIETISKRGYRLIAPVEPLEGEPETARVLAAPERRPATARAETPYAAGQWVRGSGFYGRAAQIVEILDGNRDAMWLLGTRMIGKTSLLKQLEHLTADDPGRGYFPLFWDLQGAAGAGELHDHLRDALLESEERLERVGLSAGEIAAEDLFVSLSQLRRRLLGRELKLLLLCDEVEELIALQSQDPVLLRKLRRAMQSQEGVRTVLAASSRLWALARGAEVTSPFLHGFTPPIYLAPFDDDEARRLILQEQLDSFARPEVGGEAAELIAARCGNHPYLLQLLCTRYLELRDLDAATAEVTADPAVSFLFSTDLELLSSGERTLLHALAGWSDERSANDESVDMTDPTLAMSLHTLDRLGLIRRVDGVRFRIANAFLLRWLRTQNDS